MDENPTVESSRLAEIFTIRKTTSANIIKEEKNIRSQHELFHEKSTKRTCSVKKVMRSYTSGTRDVVLLTFIQMDHWRKRRQKRSKKDFRTVDFSTSNGW